MVGAAGLTAERAQRDVQWVRVLRPRVPAFEGLERGDLAIIHGPALAVVAPEPSGITGLAAALAGAAVPGVLLVEGDVGDEALTALGDAASAAGTTVLALGRVDPVALERSIIGFLVNRRAEIDRRAAELEAQLARLALAGGSLEMQAAAIGASLGRAVVIEGRRGDALAIHAPADVSEAGVAVARYLARPSVAVALRVEIPAPAGEVESGGHLVLLGDDPPDGMERLIASRMAGLLALELARETAIREARAPVGRSDALPADGPPWVVLLAYQGELRGPDDLLARDTVRRELGRLWPRRRLVLRGSSESLEIRCVAALTSDDPAGLVTAGRLAAFLGRSVAVSRPFSDPGARPAAEASARATLEAAAGSVGTGSVGTGSVGTGSVGTGSEAPPPAVLRAARLPAYQLLRNVQSLPDGPRLARELLAPILTGSEARRRARLETLAAVVGSASIGDAAARLGVHRNTVAYRISRLEELADWDLSDPDLRFTLELAIRLVHDSLI